MKLKHFNKKLINFIKLNKKLSLIALIGFIIILSSSFGIKGIIDYNNEKRKAQNLEEISFRVVQRNDKQCKVVVTFANENGIKSITDFNGNTINANGKMIVAIDYELIDKNPYDFNVVYKDGTSKNIPLDFKFPRLRCDYKLYNNVYANAPELDGFDPLKTRYVYYDEDGEEKIGDWIKDAEPENWYDYGHTTWANIYVEDQGIESYYVWIPRYVYKKDTVNSVSGNERMDVKFVDNDNYYKDPINPDNDLTWEELEEQGYKLPEAFIWDSQYGDGLTYISGYWQAKYQVTNLSKFSLDFTATVDATNINITNVKVNSETPVATYKYALDGEVWATTANSTYNFVNAPSGDKLINVSAYDSNGALIGSMTKNYEVVTPNAPDLTRI